MPFKPTDPRNNQSANDTELSWLTWTLPNSVQGFKLYSFSSMEFAASSRLRTNPQIPYFSSVSTRRCQSPTNLPCWYNNRQHQQFSSASVQFSVPPLSRNCSSTKVFLSFSPWSIMNFFLIHHFQAPGMVGGLQIFPGKCWYIYIFLLGSMWKSI